MRAFNVCVCMCGSEIEAERERDRKTENEVVQKEDRQKHTRLGAVVCRLVLEKQFKKIRK